MSIGMSRLLRSGATIPVPALTAFMTPKDLYISLPFSGGTGSSTAATLNIAGGVAPYTFLWTKVSGQTMQHSNDDLQFITFSTNTSLGSIQIATYKCVVTDSLAATAEDTVDILAEQFP